MELEETTTTTADQPTAWAMVAAVTTWPQWTASITSVRPLDGAEMRIGSRFRLSQPGMPPLVWQISEVREGQAFTWEARSMGVRTVAYHQVSRDPDGTTRITIGLRQTGMLAGVVGWLTGARTRRYLGLEIAGLKAASEAANAG